MNKESTCPCYTEDDWGICRHRIDCENEDCIDNCFLNFYESDSNTTSVDTKEEEIYE